MSLSHGLCLDVQAFFKQVSSALARANTTALRFCVLPLGASVRRKISETDENSILIRRPRCVDCWVERCLLPNCASGVGWSLAAM